MKQLFLLLCLSIVCLSCGKRTVQLPVTYSNSITVVNDISAAYLFYNEENDSVEFNRKNLISTTNWLVNIDKRLALKHVIPSVNFLQDKRKKSGMHSNPNAKNFYSCSNPEIQNLTFIDFTDIIYHNEPALEFFSNDIRGANLDYKIFVSFSDDTTVLINKDAQLIQSDVQSFHKQLYNSIEKDSLKSHVFLSFDENLNFQDYITIKSKLLNIKFENAEIAKDEFIYN